MTFITEKLKDLNQRSLSSNEHVTKPNYNGEPIVTRFRFDVEDVMRKLRTKIYAQDEVIQRLEEMLKIIWSDITDPHRPLYVALFLGPTGVGKTEIIRALAEAIHGSAEEFCRIDMNTLAQEHYAAALTGAPPGYVGSKEGASLFDPKKVEGSYSKPGIVLFDELEKANNQVIYSLLNAMDNGIMVMTSGQKVINFRNAMIFMTSNLGAEEIIQFADDSPKAFFKRIGWKLQPAHWGQNKQDLLKSIIHKKLEKRFSPEFINRLDDVFVFNWLEEDGLCQILDALIFSLNQRIARYNLEVQLDSGAKRLLLQKGFDRKYGARFLKRAVRRHVEVPLAAYLANRSQNGQRVVLKFTREGTQLRANTLAREAAAHPLVSQT